MGIIKAGVIGYPIEHSLSPKLHGFWLKKYDIAGSYKKILVAPNTLKQSINKLRDDGFAGFNVTIPYKEEIMPLLDTIDEKAKQIGAVNTVVIDDNGKFHGSNTDGYGFIQNLYEAVPDFKAGATKAVVLGAGGASRAVIFALVDAGVHEIYILNRTLEKAEVLIKDFQTETCKITALPWKNNDEIFKNANLIVNTTSLGMTGNDELNLNIVPCLLKEAIVYDLVYSPLYTKFLRDVKQKNCKIITGIGMLIYQAVPGFELWFGQKPETMPENLL